MDKIHRMSIVELINKSQEVLFLLHGGHQAVAVPVAGAHGGQVRSLSRVVDKDHRFPIQSSVAHVLLIAVHARLEVRGSMEAFIHGFVADHQRVQGGILQNFLRYG